jgi:outer membrane protein TolC
MTLDEYHRVSNSLLPPDLATNTAITSHELPDLARTPKPTTVDDPEQPIRYVSAQECVAQALENGRGFGGPVNTNPGANPYNSTFIQSTERGVSSVDSIRVLALEPAFAGTGVEIALSKFDVQYLSGLTYSYTDQQVGTANDQFLTGNTALNNIARTDATYSSSLIKPLPTGGFAGITFSTAYEATNLPARVNPSYRPDLQFGFEQPLLQAFGVEANQLRSSVISSLLFPQLARYTRYGGELSAGSGNGSEGILISRIRINQSRAEFERQVQLLVVKVEIAYWNLYAAYGALYSAEEGLRDAYEAWRIFKVKNVAGAVAAQDVDQARGQYELFRGRRHQALGQVLERERQLRGLMGLPVSDGVRLVPADAPTLAPYQPDWDTGLAEALTLRPELVLAREDLKARQLQLRSQQNLLLPDLRLAGTYDITGIGSRLDGPTQDNAFRAFASNHFDNWQIQLQYATVLGYRAVHAAIREFQIRLAQSYFVLQDQEKKVESELAGPYRNIIENYDLIQMSMQERKAYAHQHSNLKVLVEVGKATAQVLLEAQRFLVDARTREYQNIAQYNIELANWEYQKGTILQHDNIQISEGALPQCVQVRAVEHQRERTKALVVCERSQPVKADSSCQVEGDAQDPMSAKGAALPVLFPDDKIKATPASLPTMTLPGASNDGAGETTGTVTFPAQNSRLQPVPATGADSGNGTAGTITFPGTRQLPNVDSGNGAAGTVTSPGTRQAPDADSGNGTIIYRKPAQSATQPSLPALDKQ